MIIIKYKGGLGNQMFQYAMQLAIEKKYRGQQVLADTSHYLLLNEHNGYELESVWGICLTEATREQLKKVSPYYYPGAATLHLPEKLRKLVAGNFQYKYKDKKLQKNSEMKSHYYKQKTHCSYEQEIWELEESKDWYLDGLWQNTAYFDEVEEAVRTVFNFRNKVCHTGQDLLWMEQIKNTDSVSVHVRRGDFKNSKFDICRPEYYRRAMQIMDDEIQKQGKSAGNRKYFFFTDDVAYVEEIFKDIPASCKEIVHHDTGSSILDMELMSLCSCHIISNSTFAWWAAWLDEKPDSITVGPASSIKKPDGDYPLSAPGDWILLEV